MYHLVLNVTQTKWTVVRLTFRKVEDVGNFLFSVTVPAAFLGAIRSNRRDVVAERKKITWGRWKALEEVLRSEPLREPAKPASSALSTDLGEGEVSTLYIKRHPQGAFHDLPVSAHVILCHPDSAN